MKNAKRNSAIKGTVSLLRWRRRPVLTLAAAIAFTFKIHLKRRGVNIGAFNIEQLSQFTIGRQHRLRYEVLESDIRERNHPGRRSLFEMTSNLRDLFASVLVAAAATGMLFAQAAPRTANPAAPNQAVRVHRNVGRLRALLNLSPDQQQQAARIFSNAAMANAALRPSLRAARASLASATKANDTSAITQVSNTIGKLRSQLAANNAQARAAFLKILTTDIRRLSISNW